MFELNLLSMGTAFFAGILSCVSPCTLPLMPAYLSYITGISVDQFSAEMSSVARRQVLFNAIAFVLGLSIIFTLLGASASALGNFLLVYQDWLARIGGVIIIIFGLHILGILRIGFLEQEKRLDFTKRRASGYFGSVIMGASFGVGWTPCVGPILGVILTMAAQTSSIAAGMLLLFIYAMGMSLPYILAGLMIGRLFDLIKGLGRHMSKVNAVSGVLVIFMGLLVFGGQFLQITLWFTRIFGTGLAP